MKKYENIEQILEETKHHKTLIYRIESAYFKIKDFAINVYHYPRNIRWWFERAQRGYSEHDCWNGDHHLARQIAGILRWHVYHGNGISSLYLPGAMEYSDLEFELAVEARNAEYLHYADIFEEYAKNSIALDEEWQKELGGVLDRDMKNALQWLSEHFYDLWD